MAYLIRSMVAASAFIAAAGAAHADTISMQASQFRPGIGEQLSFSSDFLGALDTGKMSVTAYAPGRVTTFRDEDGFYVEINAFAPLSTLNVNTEGYGMPVTGVSGTGGFTVTAPVVKSVSSGGSLTVTDLSVDVASKQIRGTLIGANGVGKLDNMVLWNFSMLSPGRDAAAVADIGCGRLYCPEIAFYSLGNTILSGLSITPQAQSKLVQSLGLSSLGKAAINGITDYGVLQIGVVPEPSTCALMGVGLASVGLAARRRGNKA